MSLTERGPRATTPARLPALPVAPTNVDQELRRWLEAVREWLEVRLGARGDYYERAVTFRDLEPALDSLRTRLDALAAAVDAAAAGADLQDQLNNIKSQISQAQRLASINFDSAITQITNVSTQVKGVAVEDVSVWAVDMRPTITNGANPIESIEFGPNQPNFHAIPFPHTADTSCDFHTMLPFAWAGKYFRVYLYWGHGSGGTSHSVAWEVVANTTYDDESVILDFVPGTTVLDTGGTAGNLYIAQSDSVPIASYENEEGSMVSLRVYRRAASNAADTMDITAYLLAVRFTLADIPVVAPTPVGPVYLETRTDTTSGLGVLSNSKRTFYWNTTGTSFECAFCPYGLRTGKRYWEIQNDGPTAKAVFIGVIGRDENGRQNNIYPANPYGESTWLMTNNGSVGGLLTNGTGANDAAYGFTVGDVIGVAMDFDTGKVWFSKNGTWISGNPAAGTLPTFTGVPASCDPYVSLYWQTGALQITGNFSAGTFAYTPPAGFSAIDSSPDAYTSNVALQLEFIGPNLGTTFTDTGPLAKAITRTGGVITSRAHWVHGESGANFVSGSYLTVADPAGLDLQGVDFTVEGWIRFDAGGTFQTLVDFRGSGPLASGWSIYIGRADRTINIYHGPTDTRYQSPSNSIPAGGTSTPFFHWAVVRSGSTVTFFINGTNVYSTTYNPPATHSSGVRIGANQDGSSGFIGYMDSLRITRGVARYTSNFVPWWHPPTL